MTNKKRKPSEQPKGTPVLISTKIFSEDHQLIRHLQAAEIVAGRQRPDVADVVHEAFEALSTAKNIRVNLMTPAHSQMLDVIYEFYSKDEMAPFIQKMQHVPDDLLKRFLREEKMRREKRST